MVYEDKLNVDWPSISCCLLFCLRLVVTSAAEGSGLGVAPNHFWTLVCFHCLSILGLLLRMILAFMLITVFNRSPVTVTLSRWCTISNQSLTGLRSLEFRVLNEFGFDRDLLNAEVRRLAGIIGARRELLINLSNH